MTSYTLHSTFYSFQPKVSWNTGTKGESDHYPCDIFPGKDHCGESTRRLRTKAATRASPLVDDCKQIIRNFEKDASADWTHGITGQRDPQIRLMRERVDA